MTDTTLTDLAPFFDRHDRRNRLAFVAALCASLALSAVIYAHGAPASAASAAIRATMSVFGIALPPVFIVGWWIVGELMARGRRKSSQPDGRHLAGADDARNGVRIANRGFVFNVVVTAAVIVQQAVIALIAFGQPVGDLIPRATMVAAGAVTIYLGDLWPRMPTPRDPQRTARMRANRLGGWVMVSFGLLAVLLGLFLPVIYPLVRALPRP
jgi:hypothetical protein